MVVWGETASHLINLTRYNIVNHRPLVAQRFINKLKQSLFYRQEALQLEKLVHGGKVPGLRNALEGKVDIPARFANVLNIVRNYNIYVSVTVLIKWLLNI